MKRFFVLGVLIFLMKEACVAQTPNIQWQKSYGGSYDEEGNSICKTIDGCYAVIGFATSSDGDVLSHYSTSTDHDYWFIKIDSLGNLLWNKCFGGSSVDIGYGVKQNFSGNYIAIGKSESHDGNVLGLHGGVFGEYDYWVFEFDSTGTILWQKCLGGTYFDEAHDLILASDSGYVVTGYTRSLDGDITTIYGNDDIWVVKLNQYGVLEWQKSLGGSDIDQSFSVKQTPDGGYYIAGRTLSNDGLVHGNHGSASVDAWVVKIDSSGQFKWQHCYGGSSADWANEIIATSDGGFYLSATSNSNDGDVSGGHGNSDFWLLKADSTGSIQWQKCFGGINIEESNSACSTSDGGVAILGTNRVNSGMVTGNHGWDDYWIIKIDSAGNFEWGKSLGGTGDDVGESILQTSDDGYIVTGYSRSNDGDVSGNHGGEDVWVVKLAPLGLQTPELKNNLQDLTVFQTNDQINLRFFSKTNRDAQFSIYNLEGQQIFSEEAFITEGINHHSISCSGFVNGIYFLKIDGEDFSMGEKVVIAR